MPLLTDSPSRRLLCIVIGCMPATLAIAQQQYAPQNPPQTLPSAAPQSPSVGGQAQAAPAQFPVQRLPQPAATAPQVAPHIPPEFQLNTLEQAFLDQVLSKWESESGKINTFSCKFERLDFNAAFRPAENMPLSIDQGELSYQKPDKGSFQITEIKKWQTAPPSPGQAPAQTQGEYVVQQDAVGEHWVCDGASVFEYRSHEKLLLERPIPAHMQGKAIVDGPLPFLFGAEAEKLKRRYWLMVIHDNQAEIWILAAPKFPADAANFSSVRVILDRQLVLPKAMEVNLPDKSRHVYKFDLANASINNPLARIGALFQRPRTPFGWKRKVEQMPVEQAAQPADAPR